MFGDSRCFRPVQFHTTHTQQGQNGDGQYNDSHPTEPLDLLPVIQNGTRQLIQSHDDRRAGSGKSRDGFENGVSHAQMKPENKRQRACGA